MWRTKRIVSSAVRVLYRRCRCCENSKEMSPLYFGLEVFFLFESQNLTINPSHLDCTEPEFLNIYWRLKSQLFREDPSFQRSECTAGLILADNFQVLIVKTTFCEQLRKKSNYIQ
jgi:hypothetical protein